MLGPVSALRPARQKLVPQDALSTPTPCPKGQNIGLRVQVSLFLSMEKPGGGGILQNAYCTRQRDYDEKVLWVFLLASVQLDLSSPGMWESLNGFPDFSSRNWSLYY